MPTIDLASPDTYTNGVPHEVFRGLRAEAPVAWQAEPKGRGYWSVVRHQDCAFVLRRPDLYSSWRGGALLADPPPAFLERLRGGMMHRDPPGHTALRGLVAQTFHPRRVAELDRDTALIAASSTPVIVKR